MERCITSPSLVHCYIVKSVVCCTPLDHENTGTSVKTSLPMVDETDLLPRDAADFVLPSSTRAHPAELGDGHWVGSRPAHDVHVHLRFSREQRPRCTMHLSSVASLSQGIRLSITRNRSLSEQSQWHRHQRRSTDLSLGTHSSTMQTGFQMWI